MSLVCTNSNENNMLVNWVGIPFRGKDDCRQQVELCILGLDSSLCSHVQLFIRMSSGLIHSRFMHLNSYKAFEVCDPYLKPRFDHHICFKYVFCIILPLLLV